MKESLRSSETSVLTSATRRNIPEDAILHSHRRENLKSYIALTDWTLQRRHNVSHVKYEVRSYISQDAILHSHRRENLKSYSSYENFHFLRYRLHGAITQRKRTFKYRSVLVYQRIKPGYPVVEARGLLPESNKSKKTCFLEAKSIIWPKD
jgi:hypothetical protein